MKPIFLPFVAAAFCLAAQPLVAEAPSRGMVASVHPLATQAGLDALKSGGNAIDAAAAVGLTLGVVDTHNSGIGGGCFLLIHLANGTNLCIDGREMAPAAVTRNLFLRDGKGDTQLSQNGPLASGVPGELAAFDFAVRHYGKKSLASLILPAAEIAEKGFPFDPLSARLLKSVAPEMRVYPASTAVFFRQVAPLPAGEILRQPDLAEIGRAHV